MATDSTIKIGAKGGTISWSATSDPPYPTISITGDTNATASGNIVTVPENTDTKSRKMSVSVNASTSSNSAYSGIASVTSGYTIEQDGKPAEPQYRTVTVSFSSWYVTMHDQVGGTQINTAGSCTVYVSVNGKSTSDTISTPPGSVELFSLGSVTLDVLEDETEVSVDVSLSPSHSDYTVMSASMSGALGSKTRNYPQSFDFGSTTFNIGTGTTADIYSVEFNFELGENP